MPLRMFIKGKYQVCNPLGQGQLAYLGESIQTEGKCEKFSQKWLCKNNLVLLFLQFLLTELEMRLKFQ